MHVIRTTEYSATSTDETSERAAERAVRTCREKLSGIGTAFGRLAYMASLREEGAYRSPAARDQQAPKEAQPSIEAVHREVFKRWLVQGIGEQKRDLAEYLRAIGQRSADKARAWRDGRGFLSYPPPSASEADRYLYQTDLDVAIELVASEQAG